MGGDDNHEEDEEDEADGVYGVRNACFDWAADDTFNNDKEEAATVERGDGDEIDEREIDRNDSHDGEK